MNDQHLALVKEVHRKEAERLRALGLFPIPESTTVPFELLPELKTNHPLHRAWNTYRRVAQECLSNGLEGVWLVLKDDQVLGVYPAARLACQAIATEVDDPAAPFLIKQVRKDEPVTTLTRLELSCPSLPMPLGKTA